MATTPRPSVGVVEVAIPTGTFITGGGYLNEMNSTGSNPAANPSKMNFGFNVKYNSKGTNPQGHVNVIFRGTGGSTRSRATRWTASGPR